MGYEGYDFCGWASKNNLKCLDGKVIKSGAFKAQDGQKVPLVWNHEHNAVEKVLGHAYLENRAEGVYAYAYFNNTPAGEHAKNTVKHGDVTSMSIWATNVQAAGNEVMHGVIREVSLVLAGANPGAFIESVVSHGYPFDEDDEEGIFYTGEDIIIQESEGIVSHAAEGDEAGKGSKEKEDPTVGEVLNSLTDIQKKAVAIVIGQVASKDGEDDEEKEGEEVKHNVFEGKTPEDQGNVGVISHALKTKILEDARNTRSLREAVKVNLQEGEFFHSIDTTGMEVATGTSTYGINDMDMLFPEYKNLNMPPEFISRNMEWVTDVLTNVSKSPFARIKTMFADITEDEARAKGYIKGKEKKSEVFSLLKRKTDPQTVYKKQQFDRDDILDVTEFEVIPWVKSEMRIMMNEEKARAMLIGDGRLADDPDKIQEQYIRPIASDVPLFNITVTVKKNSGDDESKYAKAIMRAALRSRKSYKGSGNPTFYTTEDVLTEMLLLEDNNGLRIYKTVEEVATALRVKKIVTVEPMEGHKVEYNKTEYPLIGIIVNMTDYKMGRNPKVNPDNFFEDFDLDYNQMKYLLEDRFSGALVKPYSAITLLRDEASSTVTPASTY